jgi:hypothetical protein
MKVPVTINLLLLLLLLLLLIHTQWRWLALLSTGTTKNNKGIKSREHCGSAAQAKVLQQQPTAEQLSKYHVVLMSYENFMVRCMHLQTEHRLQCAYSSMHAAAIAALDDIFQVVRSPCTKQHLLETSLLWPQCFLSSAPRCMRCVHDEVVWLLGHAQCTVWLQHMCTQPHHKACLGGHIQQTLLAVM